MGPESTPNRPMSQQSIRELDVILGKTGNASRGFHSSRDLRKNAPEASPYQPRVSRATLPPPHDEGGRVLVGEVEAVGVRPFGQGAWAAVAGGRGGRSRERSHERWAAASDVATDARAKLNVNYTIHLVMSALHFRPALPVHTEPFKFDQLGHRWCPRPKSAFCR